MSYKQKGCVENVVTNPWILLTSLTADSTPVATGNKSRRCLCLPVLLLGIVAIKEIMRKGESALLCLEEVSKVQGNLRRVLF